MEGALPVFREIDDFIARSADHNATTVAVVPLEIIAWAIRASMVDEDAIVRWEVPILRVGGVKAGTRKSILLFVNELECVAAIIECLR